jgi:hypothetical protein
MRTNTLVYSVSAVLLCLNSLCRRFFTAYQCRTATSNGKVVIIGPLHIFIKFCRLNPPPKQLQLQVRQLHSDPLDRSDCPDFRSARPEISSLGLFRSVRMRLLNAPWPWDMSDVIEMMMADGNTARAAAGTRVPNGYPGNSLPG